MLRAAATLAEQAELLAHEMDAGTLVDHGGPDALATLRRHHPQHQQRPGWTPIGHA